jgi:general secretion pathway protein F
MLVDIRERVMGGSSLSRAMQEHSSVFEDYYVFMVSAGEESGTLDSVLDRLSRFLEIQNEVREKMRNASMYPMIMAFVAVMVLVLLFSFVIPKVVTIFETRGENLPFMTEVLIFVSNLVSGYWWALMALGGFFVWAGRKLAIKHRKRLDHLLMGVFGSLYMARFTRTLGFLMEGSLPVIKALELAGRTSGNLWLKSLSTDAAVRVSEGGSLSSSLDGLPPVFLELVSTGERSGNLPGVLNVAADGYEADFDRMVQRSLALVEPILILVMALVVGFIVFAVLLPMFQLNQIIGR